MNPKHNNPKDAKRTAHAPYNFVALPERIVTVENIPPQSRYAHFTGHIDCRLTTESPLYTRCAMAPGSFADWGDKAFHELPEVDQVKRSQFFELESGVPGIPGSSLRGMVRSLLEIVSFGKLRWVSDDPLIFRSVGDMTSLGNFYRNQLLLEGPGKYYTPLMKAGYLEEDAGRWVIHPAQQIGGTTFARVNRDNIPEGLTQWYECKNAHKVWVELGQYAFQEVRGGLIHMKYTPVKAISATSTPSYREAVLAYSGPMDKKRLEAVVFSPAVSATTLPIDEEIVRAYREQITLEQQELLGPNGAMNPHQPVFYLTDKSGKVLFFGHVMMFRLPYGRSPLDFVPDYLKTPDKLDIVEAIFGFIPGLESNSKTGCAGRVSFADAVMEPNQPDVWLSDHPITPRILSNPKPTTFQHYLTQQVPDEVETGQYDKRGNPKTELRLDHYASPPPHKTVVRGHKLYWHRGEVVEGDISELDADKIAKARKQYTLIMPVRAGVSFSFRINFENLRDFELGALLWVLSLSEATDHAYRLKLGMGKPLGMGSVRLESHLHVDQRESSEILPGRYQRLFDEHVWHLPEAQVSNSENFVAVFEKYVFSRIDPNDRGTAQGLRDTDRISMLLKMLEWPGPDRRLTTYMQIEPINEYKRRPVLPGPLQIGELQATSGTPVRAPITQSERNARTGSPEQKQTPSAQPSSLTRIQRSGPSDLHVGVVKTWLDDKGYGFIRQEEGPDVFVHHSNIDVVGSGHKSLRPGQRVTFGVIKTDRGFQAVNVKPAD